MKSEKHSQHLRAFPMNRLLCTCLLSCFTLCGFDSLAQDRDSSNAVLLTLREAISLALVDSPDIAALKIGTELSEQDITLSKSELDTILSASFQRNRQQSPSASSVLGFQYVESDRQSSVSLSKKLEVGTELGVYLSDTKTKNDALSTALTPRWGSEAGVQVTQPLLRGAWSGRPAITIQVKKELYKSSLCDFRTSLTDEMLEVEDAYWRVYLANEEQKIKEKSLGLATKLKENAKTAVDLGVHPKLSFLQAKTRESLRQEELYSSKTSYEIASNTLKQVLGAEKLLLEQTPIHTLDLPEYTLTTLDEDKALELALKERPEICSVTYRLESTNLEKQFAKNSTLPKLDLVGRISSLGLAGTPVDGNTTSPLSGSMSDSYDQVFGGDYYNYRFGFQVSMPLENRAARATHTIKTLEHERYVLQLAKIKQLIIAEVKNSRYSFRAAKQRIATAKEAKELAEKSVEMATEQFKAGVGGAREVLELQEDLAQAESSFARASVELMLAFAQYYKAVGSSLERFDVEVQIAPPV